MIAGIKLWSLNLFQMNLHVCWVQENLQASLGMSTLHVIVASIVKLNDHSKSN